MGDSDTATVSGGTETAQSKKASAKNKTKKGKGEKADANALLVSGKLTHLAVGPSGIEFSIKGKKGKAESFNLSDLPNAIMPSAAAMLTTASVGRTKIRLEFSSLAEGQRKLARVVMQS
jgi:hypothetical protein